MTHMYFSTRAEGRISYGHLGRTNSCLSCAVMHLCEMQWTNASTPWKVTQKITLYTCGHLQAFVTKKCKWGFMWRFYIVSQCLSEAYLVQLWYFCKLTQDTQPCLTSRYANAFYTVVQKNAPTLADYNYDPVLSILIILASCLLTIIKVVWW